MRPTAQVGQRLIAGLIDIFLFLTVYIFVVSMLTNVVAVPEFLNRLAIGLFLMIFLFPVLFMVFEAMMISRLGGTPGKLLTGLEVVDGDGKRLSFWRALFRNGVGHTISGMFLYIGFIWIAIDRDRRAWHDMMVGSRIVVVNPVGTGIGLISFFVVVGVNLFLISLISSNFSQNKRVYQELFNQIRLELKSDTFTSKPSRETQDFTTLAQGKVSGQTVPRQYVITSRSDWERIIGHLQLDDPDILREEVDFNKQMVIAVFQGLRSTGGYSLEVTKIVKEKDRLEGTLVDTSPGSECIVTEAETTPYHIVTLPKINQKVLFVTEYETIKCN